MILVTIFKDKSGLIKGFSLKGHAGYDAYGSDIVCSAVSALSINTCNSIEAFCNDEVEISAAGEEGGSLILRAAKPNENTELLLKSFDLGINQIAADYGKHVNIEYQTK